MNSAVVTQSASIIAIADQIKAEHKAVELDLRSSIAHAIRCGELLNEAKASLSHGAFTDWIAGNFKFSSTAARGYMRLAGLDNEQRQRVADLSLREALKDVANGNGRRQKRIAKQAARQLTEAQRAPHKGKSVTLDVTPTRVDREPVQAATTKRSDVEKVIAQATRTTAKWFAATDPSSHAHLAGALHQIIAEYKVAK